MKKYDDGDINIEDQVPPSSPVLIKVAAEIPASEIINDENQQLIDRLFRVTYGRQGDTTHRTVVGLAAPQIGVSKRVVVVGTDTVGAGEQPTMKELINPVIIFSSDETEEGREGCFSTGKVCGIVTRAKYIKVRAYDRNGNEIIYETEGFPARIAQHEIDHLDGIRFADKITDPNKLHWVEEAEFGEYRNKWQNWPTKCPLEMWQSVKYGK